MLLPPVISEPKFATYLVSPSAFTLNERQARKAQREA